MKGITVTDKLGLKGGVKGSVPFIKLISHEFKSEEGRTDCKIGICKSLAISDTNDKRAADIQLAYDTIKEQKGYMKTESGKFRKNATIKKFKADLILLGIKIIKLENELEKLEDGGNRNTKETTLKAMKVDYGKLIDGKRKEIKKRKTTLTTNLNKAKQTIEDSYANLNTIKSPEPIWTYQYPSFDSAKELSEKEVYDLIKAGYKGVKEVA